MERTTDISPDRLAQIMALAQTPSTSAASTVTINAGGVGVWIATLCAVLAAGLALALAGEVRDLRADVRELRAADTVLQAYINAGYAGTTEEAPK